MTSIILHLYYIFISMLNFNSYVLLKILQLCLHLFLYYLIKEIFYLFHIYNYFIIFIRPYFFLTHLLSFLNHLNIIDLVFQYYVFQLIIFRILFQWLLQSFLFLVNNYNNFVKCFFKVLYIYWAIKNAQYFKHYILLR